MLEEEAKKKITAYFERLGIDLKSINFARVVFQFKDGDVVNYRFLDDDEPDPTNIFTPQQKNSIH
ncbi:hypothetical protein [Serratia fonticola]|uniref:hypothetical protein n=1 Tax=Serratia fonticola TaxID=47917 RepID=UPI00217C3CEE|nr:hypothetical protein [Serratia fonticola]CAI2007568.1 Uncharacterised protein [Serratia fonticola]